jgi:hypothetical protein
MTWNPDTPFDLGFTPHDHFCGMRPILMLHFPQQVRQTPNVFAEEHWLRVGVFSLKGQVL